VHRLQGEGAEDQEIEGPLQYVGGGSAHGCAPVEWLQ
jgi:hypothetical protein